MPDSEAVTLWRDRFRLNLSASWKRDVEKTVTDLDLWREVLDGWFYFDSQGKKRTKHPGIKGILDEYERRLQNAKANNQALALPARSRERISTGRDSDVSKVRIEPPSCYFRTRGLV